MSAPDLFTVLDRPEPDAVRRVPEHHERAAAATACRRRWTGKPQHQCSVGGGDAAFTSNGGRTWECERHVPPDFPGHRAA